MSIDFQQIEADHVEAVFVAMREILFIPQKLFERLTHDQYSLLIADILIHRNVPGNKIKNKIIIKRFLDLHFIDASFRVCCFKQLEGIRESLIECLSDSIRKLNIEEQKEFKILQSTYGVSTQFLGTLSEDLIAEFSTICSDLENDVEVSEAQVVKPKTTAIESNDSRGLHLNSLVKNLPELEILSEFFYELTFTQSKLFILSVLWNNKISEEGNKRESNRNLHTFLRKFGDGLYDGTNLSCARQLITILKKKAKLETQNMQLVDLSSLQRSDHYDYISVTLSVDQNFMSTLTDQQLKDLAKIARDQKKKVSVVKNKIAAKPATKYAVKKNDVDLEYNEVKALNNMFKDMRSQLFTAGVCGQAELQQMSDKEVVHTYMNSASITI